MGGRKEIVQIPTENGEFPTEMRVELYNILFSFPREIIIRSCRKSSKIFLYKEKYRNQKCSRRIWRISGEEQLTWQEIWKSNGIGKIAKLQLRNKKKTKKKEDPDAVDVMVWEGSKRADGKKMEKRQE